MKPDLEFLLFKLAHLGTYVGGGILGAAAYTFIKNDRLDSTVIFGAVAGLVVAGVSGLYMGYMNDKYKLGLR